MPPAQKMTKKKPQQQKRPALPEDERKKKEKEIAAESESDEEGSSAPEVSTSEEEDDSDDDSSSPSSDSSSSEDEDDDGEKKPKAKGQQQQMRKNKELNVDFQFFEPAERDFHGLRALLGSYLDGKGYEVGSLVDAVIAQGAKGDGVGTVVRAIDATAASPPAAKKQRKSGGGGPAAAAAAASAAAGPSKPALDDDSDDPADPIALVTAVGLQGYRAAPFATGVRDFVLARAEAAGKRAAFEAAWDAPRSALLLNERLVNCPPQIAPPLIQYLFEEIARARAEEAEERAELAAAAPPPPPPPSAAAACGYAFDRYVLLTRVYEDPKGQEGGEDEEDEDEDEDEEDDEDDEGGKRRRKTKKQQKGKNKQQHGAKAAAPVLVYTRPEDRFFHAHSTASFTFPVEGRAVSRGALRPLRLALVLPASAVAAARRELDSAVGNARAMPPPPPRRY